MPDDLATLETQRSKLLEEFLDLGDLRPGSITAVTRLTRLMAVTLWLTASTRGGGDAAGAKVAELCKAPSNQFTSLF